MNAKLEMNPEEMKKTRRKIENGILRLNECINPNEVLWLLEQADINQQLKAEVAWSKSGLIDLESAESAVDDLMRGNDKLKAEVEMLQQVANEDQIEINNLRTEVERLNEYILKSDSDVCTLAYENFDLEQQKKVLREMMVEVFDICEIAGKMKHRGNWYLYLASHIADKADATLKEVE